MIRLLQTLLALFLIALPSFGAPYADPTPFPPESRPDPNIVQPTLVKRVAAAYPASAAAKQLRDEVFVAFEVDAQGRVHSARAFFSHFAELEQPAIDAVRQWQFTPALLMGHPVTTRMIVSIQFEPNQATR